MIQRAPETSQRAIKLPGFIGHIKLHGKYVEGVINLFRLYCMVDITNKDILKLCKIHIDLTCPDKIWSIIILAIILKCYDQISLSIARESDFKHGFYGFTLMPLEKYC